MEYVKGDAYFYQSENRLKSYPYLNHDFQTDILIIGGGAVGSIANYYLSKKYDATLVDKSRFGSGCTSCATVLLEYQLDDYAENLQKIMSEKEIVDIYRMGLESIKELQNFINQHGNHCHFALRGSLLYTNKNFGINAIEKEFLFRKKNNFHAKLIYPENNPFPFDFKAGLYCEDGGAEFNPYLFTKQMIENSQNQDNLFENTEIISITKINDGFIATTNFHDKIYCKKIIFATGYNFELLSNANLCDRAVSYTIVTNPIKELSSLKTTLFQDDEVPYHYMRILPDNRIIFGGEDSSFKKDSIDDKLAQKKYAKLKKALCQLLPQHEKELEIAYEFCGAFGSTENNLGLIGKINQENVYYMLSCGANEIINAIFGAKLLIDIFENKANKLEHLFSPLR